MDGRHEGGARRRAVLREEAAGLVADAARVAERLGAERARAPLRRLLDLAMRAPPHGARRERERAAFLVVGVRRVGVGLGVRGGGRSGRLLGLLLLLHRRRVRVGLGNALGIRVRRGGRVHWRRHQDGGLRRRRRAADSRERGRPRPFAARARRDDEHGRLRARRHGRGPRAAAAGERLRRGGRRRGGRRGGAPIGCHVEAAVLQHGDGAGAAEQRLLRLVRQHDAGVRRQRRRLDRRRAVDARKTRLVRDGSIVEQPRQPLQLRHVHVQLITLQTTTIATSDHADASSFAGAGGGGSAIICGGGGGAAAMVAWPPMMREDSGLPGAGASSRSTSAADSSLGKSSRSSMWSKRSPQVASRRLCSRSMSSTNPTPAIAAATKSQSVHPRLSAHLCGKIVSVSSHRSINTCSIALLDQLLLALPKKIVSATSCCTLTSCCCRSRSWLSECVCLCK
ncbi:Os02g0806350 [Oryza sativa Japonica Group]|uniref:Os02g0806350 protein n=1 Tax=Oryza sativa subsp. japonica TaxID=39947 RepID=A0A0P0VQX5_ORYSJ|nr:hypothetical protein EE612_014336 [Oryza sativa]BAS81470.1 Os02g0806350 [Oryza sativa Japonica Group]